MDYLHQGRIALEEAKGTAEQVLGDVKAIRGIFDWFFDLFRSKTQAPSPVAKKANKPRVSQKSYAEMELNLIKEIGEKISILFDTQLQVSNYYASLELESKQTYDPEQNTSRKAMERVLIELQLEKLFEQTREAMVYAPAELKDLYSRFLKMHKKIEDEQKFARFEQIRRVRLDRWKKEQEQIRLVEIISGVMAVMFISLIFGWLMWQLRVLSGGF